MSVRIVKTASGTLPSPGEVSVIAREIARYGRCTLLVPSQGERDACHRVLADAGCGLGADVLTPAAWVEALWELLGDGRRLCTNLQRQLLMASGVAGRTAGELLPLRANPGTVRMLAAMARELLPFAIDGATPEPASKAEAVVRSLLASYDEALCARGLIEPSQAAVLLADAVHDVAPACAGSVMLRDATTLPAYLVGLLAAVAQRGSATVLLRGPQAAWEEELSASFAAQGCEVVVEEAEELAPDAQNQTVPEFFEVAGPHAKARAYADHIVGLLSHVSPAEAQTVAVVSARPAELFEELAPHLAARGVSSLATRFVRFPQTWVGQSFAALNDLADRMKASEAGAVSATEWWPAPELTDWLYAPVSGADATFARAFDKKVRGSRALGVQGVLRELQSVQSRANAARRKLPADHPYRRVPAVCADAFQFIWQGRPVSALKSMLAAIAELPTSAFGSSDGRVRRAAEQAMAERALEVLADEARALDVSQAVASSVLDGLCVAARVESVAKGDTGEGASDGVAAPVARFLTLEDAALLEPASVSAVFLADVDVASYPLSHEEGPRATLAQELGALTLALEPAARLRDQVARALAASAGPAVLARVTHDRQAKDRYPAATWTELKTAFDAAKPEPVGEGDIARDFDPYAMEGARAETVACLPPQRLSEHALSYLVLKRRTEDGALEPRQFSASQIESYAGCPLCWFVSSRVRPALIDAGFTNMEKGNFVHDVMDRFHERLREQGMRRVTPENLGASLHVLDDVFAEVRAEHARGKTASSAALVPLSATEEKQVDDILPQLRRVVRYEADALAPFAPEYLEYSFNELGVTYAGWPLGGRIDRVDVDAEGRAVVIDYKHRSDANPFKLKDPTVPNKKTGEVAADDPHWLPEHTQSLIYAQALRRSLGLDVRGALYFSTKGRVAMRGAVSAELAEEEPGDGRVPGLRDGFPATLSGGTMSFEALLDRVEAGIAERLDELRGGNVAAAPDALTSCYHNHPLGFERREA